ncbi:hypothetical protein [Scytonema sp. PCC 10023]
MTTTFLMAASLLTDGLKWIYSINRALTLPLGFSALLVTLGLFYLLKK